MYSIISELDVDSSSKVKRLWNKFRDICGLQGIYQFPTPHFTWFVADELDLTKAKSILLEISKATERFTTYTSGFGLFSGRRPVMYLPVVKSQEMLDVHNRVWQEFQSCTDCPYEYYSPVYWLPHITVAINDLDSENLACALKLISFEPFNLKISIENLIIVMQEINPTNKVLYKYRFNNGGGV